jgi:hypothetical protein
MTAFQRRRCKRWLVLCCCLFLIITFTFLFLRVWNRLALHDDGAFNKSSDLHVSPTEPVIADVLCPILPTMNTSQDGLYGYPMDIFAPEQYAHMVATNTSHLYDVHTCMAFNTRDIVEQEPRPCSTLTNCPISERMFRIVRNRTQWNVSTSFCALSEALGTPGNHVRVIIFGGSVSLGMYSHGFRCWKEIDTRCKEKLPLGMNDRMPWSAHFGRWLGKVSMANVTTHNLAQPGWSSLITNNNFWHLMAAYAIHEFTENDIIFIDESINDGFSGGGNHQLIALVRRIYSISRNRSWPTIVILLHSHQYLDSAMFRESYDPQAAKLQLPIWSHRYARCYGKDLLSCSCLYRDLILAKALPHSASRFLNGAVFDDLHAGWFVHLFFAEMYASQFRYEMKMCKLHNGRTPTERPGWAMTASYYPQLEVSGELDQCDERHPAIEFSALRPNSFQHVNISITGTWTYGHDRPEKFGWITELPSANASSSSVNSSASVLTFGLNFTTNFRHARWMFKLFYLRTYHNAGLATVRICGQDVYGGMLDAYWEKKGSTPEMIYYIVNGQDILYAEPPECNENYIIVSFEHNILTPSSPKFNPNRALQKVKIISLQVCRLLQ